MGCIIWAGDKLVKKVRDKAPDRLEKKAERLPGSFDVERFEAGPG